MSGSLFYAVKISDIVFITVIYFVFGYYIAKSVDTVCEYLFGNEVKSKPRLLVEVIFQILFSIFISHYIKNNLINKIPFPLEGLGGFTHYKLKEFIHSGGLAWGIGILFYEKLLKDKIKLLKK
jgi:hypothetical protein